MGREGTRPQVGEGDEMNGEGGKCEEEGGDVMRRRGKGHEEKGLQMTRSKATKAAKKN